MYQGKQAPLDIHLGFGADCEVVQAFLDADIGKDRLDNGQSSGIDLFALGEFILAFISSIRLGVCSSTLTDKYLNGVFGLLKHRDLKEQWAQSSWRA